jgi:hypothetical protein
MSNESYEQEKVEADSLNKPERTGNAFSENRRVNKLLRYLLVVAVISALSVSIYYLLRPPLVSMEDIQIRGGKMYEVGSDDPFNGRVWKRTRDSYVVDEVKDGLRDGKGMIYNKKGGKLIREVDYLQGKPARSVLYYLNGQKKAETYFNGKEEEVINWWTRNGEDVSTFAKLIYGGWKTQGVAIIFAGDALVTDLETHDDIEYLDNHTLELTYGAVKSRLIFDRIEVNQIQFHEEPNTFFKPAANNFVWERVQ